jgi:hypothetical protein
VVVQDKCPSRQVSCVLFFIHSIGVSNTSRGVRIQLSRRKEQRNQMRVNKTKSIFGNYFPASTKILKLEVHPQNLKSLRICRNTDDRVTSLSNLRLRCHTRMGDSDPALAFRQDRNSQIYHHNRRDGFLVLDPHCLSNLASALFTLTTNP